MTKYKRQYKLSVSGMKWGYHYSFCEYQNNKKEYYKQLYRHKFDSLLEIDQVFEKYKWPHLTQYKTDNLNNPTTIIEV